MSLFLVCSLIFKKFYHLGKKVFIVNLLIFFLKTNTFYYFFSGFVIKSFSTHTISKMIWDARASTAELHLQLFVLLPMSGPLQFIRQRIHKFQIHNLKIIRLFIRITKVRSSHQPGPPRETHLPPLQPKVNNTQLS